LERLRRILATGYLVPVMCFVLVALSCATTPGFGTGRNALNILSVASPLLIVALGQMLVMLSGGIDLSVTAIMAVVSVSGAKLITSHDGLLHSSEWAIGLALVVLPILGALLGLLNGAAIAQLKMPPFIVTLTSMMLLYGLATWATGSEQIGGLPSSVTSIVANPWLGLLLATAIATAVGLGLNRTVYGRELYAVGENAETSLVSGISVSGTRCAVYVLSGLLSGIAALILTAQLETGSPTLGKNMLLDIIGAVVIGGTSLFGGRGRVSWTIGGVLFIAILDNVLNLQSLSHFAVMIAKGTLILLAAIFDSLQRKVSY
jgi:ribose/xylose/arabinose/galactoside ABC-type transport system permease subunit